MGVNEESPERDPQTYAIIGACMAVHNELGPGFLEAVYQEALVIEFTRRGIPFVREKPLIIVYSGQQLATRYDADFYCYESIILELKALSELIPKHHAQTIHYLNGNSFRARITRELRSATPRIQTIYSFKFIKKIVPR